MSEETRTEGGGRPGSAVGWRIPPTGACGGPPPPMSNSSSSPPAGFAQGNSNRSPLFPSKLENKKSKMNKKKRFFISSVQKRHAEKRIYIYQGKPQASV